MLNRRTLIVGASRIAVLLPAMAPGTNMTGQREAIDDRGAATPPAESSCLWLCVGRAALALKAKRMGDETP
jgi:hypothetical protein